MQRWVVNIQIDLAAELKQNKMILTVIPNQEFSESINMMALQLNKTFNRVMYISLNKLITPLKRGMQDQGIDTDKFFFVDGVTKTAIPNPPIMKNCAYIPSPDDLTKLSIAVTKVLQTFDPDCVFFDSLSTLLIYEEARVINEFVHSLINKITAFGVRAVFTCLSGQKEEELIRNLTLTLDKVIVGKADEASGPQ